MAEVKQYRHLFFDLDHTLWDFHTNSNLALSQLFVKYGLEERLKVSEEAFRATYLQVNNALWAQYREGSVDKITLRKERFKQALAAYDVEDENLGVTLDREYLEISPYQTALVPYALEVLDYLAPRYDLHILTNGFTEIQDVKLSRGGLKPYFKYIITSESIGVNKPHAPIFSEALRRTGALQGESLMIGDNLEADIIGARNSGIDQVYFNPEGEPHREEVTFEIQSLKELLKLL